MRRAKLFDAVKAAWAFAGRCLENPKDYQGKPGEKLHCFSFG
jgi:hypothetical protein